VKAPFLIVAALVAALAGTAAAEEVVGYKVDGAAPDSGDVKADRTRALDEAFKAATRRALEELASADARRAQADAIEREVVKRARLWVASFKVTREGAVGGSFVVDADVKIDVAKLRDRLVELGVTVGGGGAGEPDPDQAPPPATTLLLRVSTIEGALATYGAGQVASDRIPAADAAEAALRRHGLDVVPAPASGPAAKAGEGLPLSDDAARGYAGDAGAAIVVVAGVDQGAPGPVRGARGVAGLARAHVRILDASGRLLGEGRSARGATGTGAAQVAAAATRVALLEALGVALPARAVGRGDAGIDHPALPLPAAAEGAVLVRIRGATGVQAAAVETYLASAQGVKGVTLRRIAGGEIVLAVRGQRAERIGALIRGAADLAARAKVEAGAVEVSFE